MELTTDYHCKCNFGLNHLHNSSQLFSLMKAILVAKGKSLSNPVCVREAVVQTHNTAGTMKTK